jgi:hypothetical protein
VNSYYRKEELIKMQFSINTINLSNATKTDVPQDVVQTKLLRQASIKRVAQEGPIEPETSGYVSEQSVEAPTADYDEMFMGILMQCGQETLGNSFPQLVQEASMLENEEYTKAVMKAFWAGLSQKINETHRTHTDTQNEMNSNKYPPAPKREGTESGPIEPSFE